MNSESQKAINKAIKKASVKSLSLNREIRATEKSILARQSSSKHHLHSLNKRVVKNLKSPWTLGIIATAGLCWGYFKFSKKTKDCECTDKNESIIDKKNTSEKKKTLSDQEVKPLSWFSTAMNIITIAEVVCALIPAKKSPSTDEGYSNETESEETVSDDLVSEEKSVE